MLPESFTPEFLHQLELFRIRSKRSYLGARQGGHVSLKRGHGIEFSDFRKYEMGDSPRWIDWGVYARTDKLYVRRYQEEQNLSVLVLGDTSASMRTPASDRKWETARDIALAMSYMALLAQDTVIASPLGYFVSPAYSGGKAIHNLSKSILDLKFREEPQDLVKDASLAVARVRFPGVALFISDFLMPFVEIRKIFGAMMAKNLDITAIQVLGPHDINPLGSAEDSIAVDSETGQEVELQFDDDSRGRYDYLLKTHNQQIRDFFASRRIGFTSVNSNEGIGDQIFPTLLKTGIISC